MGRQISLRISREPSWAEILNNLESVGEKAVVRMIDGLPAFPDEIPEPGWQELRITLLGGMVTLRRNADEIACTTWGNSDIALDHSLKACVWAVAETGGCPNMPEKP